MKVFFKGKELKFVLEKSLPAKPKILDIKEIKVYKPRGGKPKDDHPWKKFGYQIALSNKIKNMENVV